MENPIIKKRLIQIAQLLGLGIIIVLAIPPIGSLFNSDLFFEKTVLIDSAKYTIPDFEKLKIEDNEQVQYTLNNNKPNPVKKYWRRYDNLFNGGKDYQIALNQIYNRLWELKYRSIWIVSHTKNTIKDTSINRIIVAHERYQSKFSKLNNSFIKSVKAMTTRNPYTIKDMSWRYINLEISELYDSYDNFAKRALPNKDTTAILFALNKSGLNTSTFVLVNFQLNDDWTKAKEASGMVTQVFGNFGGLIKIFDDFRLNKFKGQIDIIDAKFTALNEPVEWEDVSENEEMYLKLINTYDLMKKNKVVN